MTHETPAQRQRHRILYKEGAATKRAGRLLEPKNVEDPADCEGVCATVDVALSAASGSELPSCSNLHPLAEALITVYAPIGAAEKKARRSKRGCGRGKKNQEPSVQFQDGDRAHLQQRSSSLTTAEEAGPHK